MGHPKVTRKEKYLKVDPGMADDDSRQLSAHKLLHLPERLRGIEWCCNLAIVRPRAKENVKEFGRSKRGQIGKKGSVASQ
jgi:hypothetical protein